MPRYRYKTPKLHKHHRGQAFVKISGRQVWLGRYDDPATRERYDELIAQWLANGRELPEPEPAEPDLPRPEEVTITDLAVAYIEWCQRRYPKTTLQNIQAAVRPARARYGPEPAEEFGPQKLRKVREAMKGKGWARSNINRQVAKLRGMFKWGGAHELISERVYRRLALVEPLREGEARESGDVQPVSHRDIRRVRRRLSRQVRALVLLQLLTGARAKELTGLRARWLDTNGEVWALPLDGKDGRPKHKTAHKGKDRTIYFGPRAQRVLRQFMRPGRPLDRPLFCPREANAEAKRRGAKGGRRENQQPTPRKGSRRWKNQHGEGLADDPRRLGEAYTTSSYRRAIHRACKAAGVEPWGPHRLRHNAATYLNREFGIETANIILGHSTTAITAIYAERNERRAREVMQRIG